MFSINPGDFRHEISILHGAPKAGALDQSTLVWSTLYAQVPALVIQKASRELWTVDRKAASQSYSIKIRYMDGISPANRVKFMDRTFTIDGVINQDNADLGLELLCTEQVT